VLMAVTELQHTAWRLKRESWGEGREEGAKAQAASVGPRSRQSNIQGSIRTEIFQDDQSSELDPVPVAFSNQRNWSLVSLDALVS